MHKTLHTAFTRFSRDPTSKVMEKVIGGGAADSASAGSDRNLHQFARDGVVLLGHLRSAHDGKIELAPDLHENLAAADQFAADFVKEVDTYVARTGMPAPEETLPILRDGFKQPVITELNLAAAGITNVIWATSYKFEFSLVKLPIFDHDGYPIQTRGVTAYQGLFFVGLPWLHNGKSGLIYGVGSDAAYVAQEIVSRERFTPCFQSRSNGALETRQDLVRWATRGNGAVAGACERRSAARRSSPFLKWRSLLTPRQRPGNSVMDHQAAALTRKCETQSGARFSPKGAIWRALRIAAFALITAATVGPLSAQAVALENTRDVALVGVGQRAAMPISLLHAGSDAAEVERVMGRPTTTTALDPLGADRSLVYVDETERTEVTLTAGHVTAIALDPLQINSGSLPTRARMVKPMMRRNGVLVLLGKPDDDQKGVESGLETERMLFKGADQTAFSVLLAGGLVVDVTSDNKKAPGIRPYTLPVAVPDTSVGSDLRIGLSPKQVESLLGPTVYLPITSALEGQPVLYESRFTRSGCGVVSLTFIGEALTTFTIWSPEAVNSLGVSCSPVAERHP
jgi:hypothetical protein